VEVSGLRIAGSRVDLRFERAGTGKLVALTEARIDGDVEVVMEISGSRLPGAGRTKSRSLSTLGRLVNETEEFR
jgi:hypothetical protein